jgi:hypothetical protein
MDHKRRSHHDSDRRKRCRSRGNDDDTETDNNRHSSKRSSRSRKRDYRHDDSDSSGSDSSDASSMSSSQSSAYDRRRHHSKKTHHKEKVKKHKHKHKKKKDKKRSAKKRSRHRRSESPSSSTPSDVITAPSAPPGANELASALSQLFDSYPAMAYLDEGGIPLLFIQLSRGTEYNLSAMPDRNLARLLEAVFDAISIHGMELGGDGAWRWGNATKTGGSRQGGDDLVLLRLARALLNGVGISIESVEKYEQNQLRKLQQHREEEVAKIDNPRGNDTIMQTNTTNELVNVEANEEEVRHRKRVERMTSQLLDRFDPKNDASSLANEVKGICDVLMDGESVRIDSIENGKLKASLAQLFQLIGLEMVEMEDEDEDEDETNEERVMGYALPDTSDTATSNLNEVLRVCRFRSSGGNEDAPTSWKTEPSALSKNQQLQDESSSDDDDGPAPLGTIAAAEAMKRKRLPQIQHLNNVIAEGGREEWMMVPGEHDFLKGISKSTKGRAFKNEKMRGQAIAPFDHGKSAEPINREVLEEVHAIQKAYEQSRGPSLLDAHRQKLQESKQKQQGSKEWTWNRDKNLDDGRRVDKDALHMVLGGASTELRSKFQGSLGRS